MRNFITKTIGKAKVMATTAKAVIGNRRGENFVDSGFKVLIIVVLAALFLAGLYFLLGDVIMPTLTERVKDLFNYKG